MCGIVGYIGPKAVDSVLIVGLEKLEYRGYDSAGIAYFDRNEISIIKEKGRIADLEEQIKKYPVEGHIGIGHTRWATHGEPSKVNAHPHMNRDKTIAVVQNGIIENYLELKTELKSLGYMFISETDTEVLPHMIDRYVKEGFDLEKAFVKTLHRLDGKYAIAMIGEKNPDRVYFAKDGAPLILAEGENLSGKKELLLASDVPAFVPLAKSAYYLNDGEWGYFDSTIHLFDRPGAQINAFMEPVAIKLEDISLGEYEHFMRKEIYEQPEMLERILAERIVNNETIEFSELKFPREYLSKVARFIIQACGTSLNSGMIGKLYLEQVAKKMADADYSSEFRYRNPVAGGDTLVIGISQSGETADTLAGLREAKSKFLKVLSFVNNINSTIARESDGVIHLMAGPEIGVASTKAYTAQLTHMLLFAYHVADISWLLTSEEKRDLIKELKTIPDKMRKILQYETKIKEIAERLKNRNSVLFLGRTWNHATALEGALKLKEISYIHAEGYAAGEFKHGPIALVSAEVPVVVVAPKGEMRTKLISNLQEVKARNGEVFAIVTEGDDELASLADAVLEVPESSEILSPLLTILPLQLLSYHTAILRGCDVDKPRNLAKSVTVE
ncbi:MAG: glutamine--fructose-6-phosphate transaminase (isomerizing) [Leptospiraceae bacterium]|nr:glutamine--fructose-6-phosphate transaminase (isomerizing) [Leptospiraceae bacterium]